MSLGRVRATVERHPILTVFFLALASNAVYYAFFTAVLTSRLSGTVWLVARYTPVTVGPSLAAVTVTYVLGDDVRALLGQVTEWRVPLRYYVVALLVPNLFQLADDIAYVATGTPTTVEFDVGLFVFKFFGTLLLAGALEEFGWRGFMQPRLQSRWGAATAAVLVGVAWAVWHFPQVLTGGLGYGSSTTLPLFVLHLVGLSVLFAWMYNNAGLLPVLVCHAAYNAPAPLLDPVASAPGWIAANSYLLRTAASLSIGLVLVLAYGHRHLSRTETVSDARPRDVAKAD